MNPQASRALFQVLKGISLIVFASCEGNLYGLYLS